MKVFISAIGWQGSSGYIVNVAMPYVKEFKNYSDKAYCDCIDHLNIIPICMPDDDADMCGKESTYFGWKRREAYFSLRIQYDEFASASYEEKKRIVVNHIAKCALMLAKRISDKKKGLFDVVAFLNDFFGNDYCLLDDGILSSVEEYDGDHQ